MKLSRALKILFSLALLGVLAYTAGTSDLWQAFKELTLEAICALLLLSVILIWISAVKWRQFLLALAPQAQAPTTTRLFGLYLVGYFVNLLAPSFVGGDAVRSYYAGRQSGQHAAASATILERYTGLIAMIVLALAALGLSPLITWELALVVVVVAGAIAVITVLALDQNLVHHVARCCSWAERFQPLRMRKLWDECMPHLQRVQESFHLARKNRTLMVRAMILSFLFHTFTVINTLVAGWAVGWDTVPVGELFVVLPLILLIGAVPLTPSGLGIQEGAFFYFLQGIGATPAQALAVGLLLRAKSYVLALLGGLVWLMQRHLKQAELKQH